MDGGAGVGHSCAKATEHTLRTPLSLNLPISDIRVEENDDDNSSAGERRVGVEHDE